MKTYDFKTKAILRALSENSRASVSDLAKAAHCSRITATKALKNLIEEYGIKFGLELQEDKLGLFQRHLIIIKLHRKPKEEDLKKIFENDPYVDNVYLCEGDFTLIVHAVTSDPMKYIVWESLLPGKLSHYGVTMHPSELMHTNFGYFPVSGKVVSRFATGLDDLDKQLLAALADDSSRSASELSKMLKMNRTTIYYRLFTLEKQGIIKRFTISINKPQPDYVTAFVANYKINKTSSSRSVRMMEYYKSFDQEQLPLLNSFQILAPMSGSYRFFGMGVFKDKANAMKSAIESHKEIFSQEDVEIQHAKVVGVIKGAYPFRNLDMQTNYNRFKWSEEDLR